MPEGSSPEWKKTMVSDGKASAEEAMKNPHVHISSWNIRIQQIYGVSKEVSQEITNSSSQMKWGGY